jgi:hypothetical protein
MRTNQVQNLGRACTEEGLLLGRTPLVERQGGLYAVRAKGDLERLLKHAYGGDLNAERLLPGLTAVASALARKNLCLAQIAAVHLRLPELSDATTRELLEGRGPRDQARTKRWQARSRYMGRG